MGRDTDTRPRAVETSKWDATPTPGRLPDASKGRHADAGCVADGSKWDATPTPGRATGTATPSMGCRTDPWT